jgi:hypothetical protein
MIAPQGSLRAVQCVKLGFLDVAFHDVGRQDHAGCKQVVERTKLYRDTPGRAQLCHVGIILPFELGGPVPVAHSRSNNRTVGYVIFSNVPSEKFKISRKRLKAKDLTVRAYQDAGQ